MFNLDEQGFKWPDIPVRKTDQKKTCQGLTWVLAMGVDIWGLPKNSGLLFGGTLNQDYSILEFTLGPSIEGNYHIFSVDLRNLLYSRGRPSDTTWKCRAFFLQVPTSHKVKANPTTKVHC